jgi:hypothetical protein
MHTILEIIDSFYELQNNKEQQEWERTRFVAFMSLKPHDNKRQLKKPSDLIKFEWEKKIIDKQKLDLKQKILLSNQRGLELYKRLKKQF